jgi:hypothetical protein
MSYKDPKKTLEIRTQVAWNLLNGPEFLKTQHKLDDIDSLEPVLLIRDFTEKEGNMPTSFSVYADIHHVATDKHLRPIVRMAVWDKSNDDLSNKTHKLPKIEIIQHELTDIEQDSLHTLLVELDKSISEIEYEPDGLFSFHNERLTSLKRMFANTVSLKRTGFNQIVEFSLSSVSNITEIEQHITKIVMYIKKVCRKPMDVNFREAYHTNPFSLFDQQGEWYYKPKASTIK